MARQKPLATEIAHGVETLQGITPKFMDGQNRAPSKGTLAPLQTAMLAKIRLFNGILSQWQTILENPPPLGDLRWNDYIRVSELAAKYAGLLEQEGKDTTTINQLIIDVRSMSEPQLLAHLEKARQAKALREEPIPLVSPPTPTEGGALEEAGAAPDGAS